jgi:hypothetical protein
MVILDWFMGIRTETLKILSQFHRLFLVDLARKHVRTHIGCDGLETFLGSLLYPPFDIIVHSVATDAKGKGAKFLFEFAGFCVLVHSFVMV